MRDQDKPFILYRSGRGSIKIVPRGSEGWRQMIIWIVMAFPLIGLFFWFASGDPKGMLLYMGLAAFLIGMFAWGLGGIMWMRARSEVVDMEELLELKHERDRKRRR